MKKFGSIHVLTDCFSCFDIDPRHVNELDLGCGKGGFTCTLAAKYPGRRIFAADVMLGRLRKLERRIARESLANIELLRTDAWNLVGYSLPDESLDRMHILCPDPWPKEKHRGNRLLCSEFIGRLLRVMKKNGTVHFATDDKSYFRSVTGLFSRSTHYLRDDKRLSDIMDIKSDFENKWEAEGTSVEHSAWVRQ
ncbi:MAG TPA: hypothetical protein DET40_21270 [Lentisphaeria bacterium]|nr:MAG: hypothetical protein A2X45_03180 [Lentisphaerae bacterium GWF2_50_93]HCE46083.1 hypothetical protein [Lentisphaeria bacterium]